MEIIFTLGVPENISHTFGSLFNDIVITREDANGAIIDSIKVPITVGPKDKMLARVIQDPTLTKGDDITLPIMAIDYHGYNYDSERKLNTLGRNVRKSTDVNKFLYQYNGVGVDLSLSLYILVKNSEDGAKIIEQILPYFRPDWTASLNLIPELDLTFKIPLILDSTKVEDKYDGLYTERRAIIWSLDFTMKGWLFGPIKQAPIIKFANTRYFAGDPSENIAPVEYVSATPGLLANGEPTSNASASVSPLVIDLDDDWTYAIQKGNLMSQ